VRIRFVAIDLCSFAHIQVRSSVAEKDCVFRKDWIVMRVEGCIRFERPDVIVELSETDGAFGRVDVEVDDLRELLFDVFHCDVGLIVVCFNIDI